MVPRLALLSFAALGLALRAGEAAAGEGEPRSAEFRERAEKLWKAERDFERNVGVSRNEMFRRAMAIVARERRAERERRRASPLAAAPRWVSLGPDYAPISPTAVGTTFASAPSDSGLVNAIAIHPTNPRTVFVGPAGGGVWRTTDGGSTWTPLTDDVGTTAIGAIAIAPSDPRRLYAGCGSGRQSLALNPPGPGLLASRDGGETWRLTSSSPGNEFWFLWVHPQNADVVLAGTDKGVFRSANGGDTWTRALDAGAAWGTGFAAQPGNPSVLLATTFLPPIARGETFTGGACVPNDPKYPPLAGRLWKSTDAGITWTEKTTVPSAPGVRLSRIELAFAPSAPNVVYALLAQSDLDDHGCAGPNGYGHVHDVARSTDAGETWTAQGGQSQLRTFAETPDYSQIDYDSVISVSPVNADVVWAGVIDTARSSDGGKTWRRGTRYFQGGSAPVVHPDQHFHAWSADGSTFYVGSDGGLVASSDGGNTFRDLNRGLVTTQFYGVCQTAAAPAQVMGGSQDNGTILRKGSGPGWEVVSGGDGCECVMQATNPDVLVTSAQSGAFFRTTNGGSTWATSTLRTTAPDTGVFPTRVRLHPTDTFRLYANTARQLFESTDGGATWVGRGLIAEAPFVFDFAFFPGDPTRMVVGAYPGKVLVSTNGGTTFALAGTLPHTGISSIRYDRTDPNRLFATTYQPGEGLERVHASTDGGTTWAPISRTGKPDGLPDVPIVQIEQDPLDRNVLYVLTFVGVYRTGDLGATWRRFGTGLPNVAFSGYATKLMDILPDGSKLRLATFGRGIWEIALGAVPVNQAPGAAIDVPATTPTLDAGLPASFHGIATDPDAGDVLGTSWDFGDGTPGATGASVSHAFAVPGTYIVTFRVTDEAGLSASATRHVEVRVPQGAVASGPELLLPVVLDVVGAGGARYTTELTLISRAASPTTVLLSYTAAAGGGSGYASVTVSPGEARVISDAIAFLADRGLPLPTAGTRIGTLRATFPGAQTSEVFIGGRTSTPGAGGTFGLFYTGAATSTTTAVVFGLQQNASQRSNLALVNAGAQPVTLRVRLEGPNGETLPSPPDQALAAFGWTQLNQPLAGLAASGRALVSRIAGASPFTAYGVLNDAVTSDGSFVPPLVPGDTSGADRLVPIVLSAAGYQSELTLTNLTNQPLPLTLRYTGSPQLANAGTGTASVTLAPAEQRVESDAVAFLRSLGLPIPSSGNVGGSLTVGAPGGTPYPALAVGTRTFTLGADGGSFGLFYPGLSIAECAADLAFVHGLQQNAVQRSNLAVVHRGDGGDAIALRVTYFGADGSPLASPDTVTLAPGEWRQFNQPLAARGAGAGYARIERTSGTSRWAAYGVLNDQHNSDGSYVPMSR